MSETVKVNNDKGTVGAQSFDLTAGQTPDAAEAVVVPMLKGENPATLADVFVVITDESGADVTSKFTITNDTTGISIAAKSTAAAGKYTVTITDTEDKQVDSFTITYNAAVVALDVENAYVFENSNVLKVVLAEGEGAKVSVGDKVTVTIADVASVAKVASVDKDVVTINMISDAAEDSAITVEFDATAKHEGTADPVSVTVLSAKPDFGIDEDAGINIPGGDSTSGFNTSEGATVSGIQVNKVSDDEVSIKIFGSYPNVPAENEDDHFTGFSGPGETKGEKILVMMSLPIPVEGSAQYLIMPDGHQTASGRREDKYLTGTMNQDEIANALNVDKSDLHWGGSADGDDSDHLNLFYLVDRETGKGTVELIWVVDGVEIPVTYTIDASGLTMAGPVGG